MPPSEFKITLEWIVDRTKTVYSLPLFYERLNETINHPRSSITDIAKIINEDQGLAARILRLSNSPMFGYFGKIDSISRAVTIIGTMQLRDLALAASVMGVFKGIPEELVSMSDFWRHSIACGIIARTIAVTLREYNVERLFLAGMLHDIGQLSLFTVVPEKSLELIETSRSRGDLFFNTENDMLGFNHADIGGELLKCWKIPEHITNPVMFHHAPSRADKFPLEASIVHFADIICQALQLGKSGEWNVSYLDSAAWNRLAIPISTISAIIKQAEPMIEETFSILSEPA